MRMVFALLIGCSNTLCMAMGKPLVVCLELESPPYSTQAGGIDNGVALAVADALGLPLIIYWYETDAGDEGNPALQINALLSRGKCELAGGFAMAKNNFSDPGKRQFSLEVAAGERESVTLKPLAPSLPYHAQIFALVWPTDRPGSAPENLDDLQGLSILAEENSIADLILMAHRGGQLRKSIHHIKPGGDIIFSTLVSGDADGAWVAQHHFEAWRMKHPESPLQTSEWVHDFAINLGFAALKSSYQLLERVDEIVEDLAEDGSLEAIFSANGLTYTAPQQPYLMPTLSARLLTTMN